MAERVKSSLYVSVYGFLLSFSGWYFGYEIGMFNSFFNAFMDNAYPDIKDRDSVSSNLSLFIMFGGMISCLSAGFIIDRLGRYKSALLFMIAEICVVLASLHASIPILYAARFFHGYLACSWTFLAPLMMRELLPEKQKNLFSGMFYIFLTLGILTSYGFYSKSAGDYWRLIFALPIFFEIPKLLAFILVFRIESPKWICARAYNPEVRQSLINANLRKIYVDEDVDQMTNFIIDEAKNTGTVEEIKVSDLIGPQYRLQFLVVLLLNFMNQMTGINFLVLYSTSIFESLKLENPEMYTLFMGFVNFAGAIAITIFVTKFSKKVALVAGLGAQALGHFVLLLSVSLKIGPLAVAGVYLYMFSFAVSLGGCMYPYQADVLPASGIGIASIIQWVLSTLIGKFGKTIIGQFGVFYVFLILMILTIIGGVVFAGYGIVTENKTDVQIQDEFVTKTFMS